MTKGRPLENPTHPHETAEALLRKEAYAQAEALALQVLAGDPRQREAMLILSRALIAQGRLPEARFCCAEALRIAPDAAECHFQLGCVLLAQGRRVQAVACLERAVALEPTCLQAVLKLGGFYFEANRFEPAERWYRWALALEPAHEEANFNLASILERQARLAEARLHRDRTRRPQPLVIHTAPKPRRRVLLPWAAGTGIVPLQALLPAAGNTWIRWIVECATDAQEADLPPYDLAFNAIGNADIIGPSMERLSRLHARRPMLNPPGPVLLTRRDLLPERLAGIPGLVLPKVARLRRHELMDTDLDALLAAHGLSCPLIVRPICTQGGEGARRIERPEELLEAAFSAADALYLIAYHDSRHADEHYRKYRTIFVDRRPYPYHLAISRNWLVHYFSADMLEAPWKREEERRFLEDPGAVLGPTATRALAAIGQRLDLDFAGIDFTLLADGRILVFEANATMLVHLDDSREDFPYKHAAVPAIFAAFEAMLQRHGPAPAT